MIKTLCLGSTVMAIFSRSVMPISRCAARSFTRVSLSSQGHTLVGKDRGR